MTRIDAEKLLGGHATGTLSEEERKALYEAALGHQAIFDALMDEEALRELLVDPAAKAQLLAALEPALALKVVPFWRRTGVLGAAASLLVASLAGIAYLRSPDKAAPALRQETAKAPAAKALEAPPAEQAAPPPPPNRAPLAKAKEAPVRVLPEAPAAPPPPEPRRNAAPAAAAAALADASREQAAEFRRAEARDNLAKKAEAPKAAAVVEVLASTAPAVAAKKSRQDQPAQDVARLSPGVVSGVVGGVAPAPPRRVEWKAAAGFKPSWTLEPWPEGVTRITVKGPAGATAVLLKRSAAGVEVLVLQATDPGGEQATWSAETRLAAGEALDLYLLNGPVAEPTRLPETGPVDGFRARIHPSAKKAPVP
jgi:hypothetical protein